MEKSLSLNKFTKTYLMISFCQISFLLDSQNLVPNPSFEILKGDTCYTDIVNGVSTLNHSVDWTTAPNQGTSDLYCSCKGNGSIFYIYNNWAGSQTPLTDSTYAGIGVYSPFTSEREYIQTKLISPLIEFQAYQIGFFVSHGDNFKYELRNLGAYLGDTILYSGAPSELLNYTPQIINDTSHSLYNPNGWILVMDTLYATGTERYLVIGNFFDDSNSIVYAHTGASGGGSYYFIDDVFVTAIPGLVGLPKSETKKSQLLLYPNPNAGEFTIEANDMFGQLKVLQIFDINGKLIYTEALPAEAKKHIVLLDDLGNGIYFYKINDDNKSEAQNGKIIIIK